MGDPTTVAGLVSRWRADSIAQANGSAVSTWPALVGGVALTQATAGNQPTYQTAGIGGQPAVKFTTANAQYLLSASAIARAQPLTIFIVHKLARTDSNIQELLDAGGIQMITLDAGYDCWATATDMTGGAMTLNGSVLTYVANSASSLAIQNGSTFSTANGGGGAASGTWNIGRQSSATRYLDGSIAEILIYNRALGTADRSTVHSYIQDTYGITVADYTASGTSRPAVASGAVTLAGSAAVGTRASSAGGVTLGGTAVAQARVTAAGAITLGGTARATPPGGIFVRGALALAGTAAASARASAAGQVTLGGALTRPSPHSYVHAALVGDGVSGAVLRPAVGYSTLVGSGVSRANLKPALAYATLQTNDSETTAPDASSSGGFGFAPFGTSPFGM